MTHTSTGGGRAPRPWTEDNHIDEVRGDLAEAIELLKWCNRTAKDKEPVEMFLYRLAMRDYVPAGDGSTVQPCPG